MMISFENDLSICKKGDQPVDNKPRNTKIVKFTNNNEMIQGIKCLQKSIVRHPT
jgi:hypothetical protein